MKSNMQHKGAHSLKDRKNWLGLLLIVSLFAARGCQDCFRFYHPDTFELWRIPQGSGLCNLPADEECERYAIGLSTNSTTGSFEFYNCKPNEEYPPSSMSVSYRTEAGMKVWVDLRQGYDAKSKPFIFKETSSTGKISELYKVSVLGQKDAAWITSIYIKPGDLIIEKNEFAKSCFSVFTVLIYLGIIVAYCMLRKFMTALSVGFCFSYAAFVVALCCFEMRLEVFMLSVLASVSLGAGAAYLVHFCGLKYPKVSALLSIIVNVACSIGFLYLPVDGGCRALMAVTLVMNIVSYMICCCKLFKNGTHFFSGLNCLILAEILAFGTTLALVAICCMILPMGWTFLRYKPSQTNYPFSSEGFVSFEQVFACLGVLIVMTGICILVMHKAVREICSEKNNQLIETPEAAYMAHQTHSFH